MLQAGFARGLSCFILAWAIAFALPASPARAEGIDRIAATADRLEFKVFARHGQTLSLVEQHPYDSAQKLDAAPRVWTGEVGDAISLPRFDHGRDRLYSKFTLVDPKAGTPVGPTLFVTDLSPIGVTPGEPIKTASIKGVSAVEDIDDAAALGAHHAAENIKLDEMLEPSGTSETHWDVDGISIPINTRMLSRVDDRVRRFTAAGIRVYFIVLNGVPKPGQPLHPLVHPRTDLAGVPNGLAAFNTVDEAGVRTFRGLLEFLAQRYNGTDPKQGRVTDFIIGNEVQSHWEWYNLGEADEKVVEEDYARTLRIADMAVRSRNPAGRVYVSMDHHWTLAYSTPTRSISGRRLLDDLASRTRREGDFPWQVAFHPYPENLFDPRSWNDKTAVYRFDSPRITFHNLEVLTAYLQQPAMLYAGKPRNVILSEQGFNLTDKPDGQQNQAAGFAYAWYRVSRMPGVTAFMLYRHVDAAHEGGLHLGIRAMGGPDNQMGEPRLIYNLLRDADTDRWEKTFDFAKPIIGIKNWDEIAPRVISNDSR